MNIISIEIEDWNGIYHCIICNLYIGNNIYQLCGKSNECYNEDIWHKYDKCDNNIKLISIYNKNEIIKNNNTKKRKIDTNKH